MELSNYIGQSFLSYQITSENIAHNNWEFHLTKFNDNQGEGTTFHQYKFNTIEPFARWIIDDDNESDGDNKEDGDGEDVIMVIDKEKRCNEEIFQICKSGVNYYVAVSHLLKPGHTSHYLEAVVGLSLCWLSWPNAEGLDLFHNDTHLPADWEDKPFICERFMKLPDFIT